MKKFATLSLAAVAALTLSACGGEGAGNNVTTIDNEIVLNSEEPVDNLVIDNAVVDNAVIDNAVVETNTTTTNITE